MTSPLARSTLRTLLAALLAGCLTAPAFAQTPSDLDVLREQIRKLDEKLKSLEASMKKKEEADTATAKKQPKINIADGRVEIQSADGANSIRLRAYVHADSRWYFGDATAANDTYILRRARVMLEGKFNDIFSYMVMPEFGGTAVALLDARVMAAFSPAFQVTAGKFKTPVGLELLQSLTVSGMIERSVVTGLVANRDLGVRFNGLLFDKRLDYTVAFVNGQPDGASSNNGADFDNHKTVVVRLFAQPFAEKKDSPFRGLGFGVSASVGDYATAAGRSAGYRSDGQQTIFSYRAATSANGRGVTYSPQGYFYRGPFGVLAEYVSSSVELVNGANARKVRNTGWNLTTSYVLTGEDVSYLGGVTPKAPFKLATKSWGAFQLAARVAVLDFDDRNFAGGAASFASSANSATKVNTYGVGLNWFLNKTVRFSANLTSNEFILAPGAAPAAGSVLTDRETALAARVQLVF
ncbi:MAG: hypothetical protein HY302_08335 [Opitutae bacterium]|nr:hypothetical protein [Opitutae bacterium]